MCKAKVYKHMGYSRLNIKRISDHIKEQVK